MHVSVGEVGSNLGLQLAELVVLAKHERVEVQIFPLQSEDEDVVRLGFVPLLRHDDLDLHDASVGVHSGKQHKMESYSRFFGSMHKYQFNVIHFFMHLINIRVMQKSQ